MLPPPFSVQDVSSWHAIAEEPAGDDEKIWLTEPATSARWLFKPVIIKNGHRQGEDWAEKAASELGHILGVPCARVEMAVRDGRPGVLSLNLRPDDYELHSGAVPLSGLVPGYVPGDQNPAGRPGHSLTNIRRVLQDAQPPPNVTLPADFTAFDTFAGIVLLDAWIANRDRHDENWAVLRPHDPAAPVRLCGAYDQAGCLAYNEPDVRKANMLANDRVRTWAERGTAWRFEHSGRAPTLVALAAEALRMAAPAARSHWLDTLGAVPEDSVVMVLRRLPVLSDTARTFASEILRINRERLLDECR